MTTSDDRDHDVGEEIAARQHTVNDLVRAATGHDDDCDCHVCVEMAVDEALLRYVWRGRW